ncbi:MAG: HU family DNA-binding protein [Balneolaceae bacterium]
MTKADIVDIIASSTGLTKVDTEQVVNGFIETVIEAMKSGENIEIRGFGSYKVDKRASRRARNPRTNEEVIIPERYVPLFKPSRKFKTAVDETMQARES